MTSHKKAPNSTPTIPAHLSYYTTSEASAIIRRFAKLTTEQQIVLINGLDVNELRELLLLSVDTSNYLVYFLIHYSDADDLLTEELQKFQEELRETFFDLLFRKELVKERHSEGNELSLPHLPPDLAEEVRQEFGWVFPIDTGTDGRQVLQITVDSEYSARLSSASKVRSYPELRLPEIDRELAKEVKKRLGWEFPVAKK